MWRDGSIRNSAGRAMFQASRPRRCQTPYSFHHLARFVHQDVEGQARVFDVAAHHDRRLSDDGDDLHAACAVFARPFCQFTEPALAVGSPRAAMEREQHRTFLQGSRRASVARPSGSGRSNGGAVVSGEGCDMLVSAVRVRRCPPRHHGRTVQVARVCRRPCTPASTRRASRRRALLRLDDIGVGGISM